MPLEPVDPIVEIFENRLTGREKEIVLLFCEGWSNKRIAAKLFVSVNTVKVHAANAIEKLIDHDNEEYSSPSDGLRYGHRQWALIGFHIGRAYGFADGYVAGQQAMVER